MIVTGCASDSDCDSVSGENQSKGTRARVGVIESSNLVPRVLSISPEKWEKERERGYEVASVARAPAKCFYLLFKTRSNHGLWECVRESLMREDIRRQLIALHQRQQYYDK